MATRVPPGKKAKKPERRSNADGLIDERALFRALQRSAAEQRLADDDILEGIRTARAAPARRLAAHGKSAFTRPPWTLK